MTAVDSILARLLALHPKRIDLSLDRMRRVLERLGHPERRVPPVIHVAGTNGKGSTIAFLRAMLEAAGQERARLHLAAIWCASTSASGSARGAAACLYRTMRLPRRSPNASAPMAMRRSRCSRSRPRRPSCCSRAIPPTMLLLEVGLGGRLDATNVVERPLASVVTPVSMDHVEFLGDTIEKIAAEKAGIFRAGVPAVIAPQTDLRLGGAGAPCRARARAAACRRPAMAGDRGARPARLSGREGPARPAAAEALRPPSVRQCRHRDRGAARCGRAVACEGDRAGADARRMAGAPAAAHAPASSSRLRPRAPSCGSTAATMPTAGARSRPRSAIWRSACRARWCWSSAC